MSNATRTVIVTGGLQGIGAGAAKAFLDRGYNVIATSRNITKSEDLASSPKLAVVDGDIGDAATAARAVRTAINTFGSIDALVNNAGIFLLKPFTEYTADDLGRLLSTNLEGFIHIAQLAIRQMLVQKSGGSIVNITAALVDNPIAGVNASIPMMTKGGIQAITRSLAIEMSLLAGESVGQTKRLMSAATIIDEMMSEAEAVIKRRLGSMVARRAGAGSYGASLPQSWAR